MTNKCKEKLNLKISGYKEILCRHKLWKLNKNKSQKNVWRTKEKAKRIRMMLKGCGQKQQNAEIKTPFFGKTESMVKEVESTAPIKDDDIGSVSIRCLRPKTPRMRVILAVQKFTFTLTGDDYSTYDSDSEEDEDVDYCGISELQG
ncbi:OLC1v1010285C1 [Oldenlandia corymbosa var. corymbosa]|uniref:OLC1v1010285C1 n=1 Tax=Oldenlandia corymbosa var. corymbosa TaxID=529605 RepID=A0AAV1DTC3_OLDCO|nr:OLC1v1010285C1 [Oldenlandia corymbosa var. corymbosa]